MAKNAVSDWSATAGDNGDLGGISIAEGANAGNYNNALRELMAQVAGSKLGDIAGLSPSTNQGITWDGSNFVATTLVRLSQITATVGSSGSLSLPYSGGTFEMRYGSSASSSSSGYALATYTSAFPTNTLWACAIDRSTAASATGGIKIVTVLTDQLFVGSFAVRMANPDGTAAAGDSVYYIAIGN